MSYYRICFLLCYLIFGGIAGFTLYMFFTKFGGFGSIPDKLPDKLPDVPTTVPNIPTQTPSTPSLSDLENNKWVYGGIGIGSVVIFSLMTICGFFWCLCHSPDNRQQNNERVRQNNTYELQEGSQNRRNDVDFSNSDYTVGQESGLEQLLTKARTKLSEEKKDWLEVLLEAQEEIIEEEDDEFVRQEWKKAFNILSSELSLAEIEVILQTKELSMRRQRQQQVQTQIEVSRSSL